MRSENSCEKVVAIIQARMKSSRLPGKVLMNIQGKPMLTRVIERVKLAKNISQTIIAITNEVDDDPLAEYCQKEGHAYYRGSMQDVLDRYYQAAKTAGADVVVRLTSDCPLLDPDLIDETISIFMGRTGSRAIWSPVGDPEHLPPPVNPSFPWDFAATRLPPPWERSFPIGLDVEVCSFAALERAWQEATAAYEREHVLPYLYDEPNRFRCVVGSWNENHGNQRWTVDTEDDLKLVNEIYSIIEKSDFGWLDILNVIKKNPKLLEINAGIHHKDFREVDSRRS